MNYSLKYLMEYLDIGASGANMGDAMKKENRKYARRLKKQALGKRSPYLMKELQVIFKNLKNYDI
jgi:hypothetical protein